MTTLFLEVLLLSYLEKKSWKTLFTPLNFLMLPYVLVLCVTILISGHNDFVEFYYPSVIFWIIGLFLFAVPSFTLSFCLSRYGVKVARAERYVEDDHIPAVLVWISVFLCLVFAYRFYSMSGSSRDLIGSEEFSMEFCGHGIWAHLRQISLPIVIIMIYMFDRKRWWWMLPVILGLLLINLMYQVKGWVLIPVMAGLAMRICSGKTRLSLSLLFYVTIGAFLVFIIMYLVMPVLAGGTAGPEIFGFIFKHFFHYLSSGILGLSADMLKGFPDSGEFEIIWSPFINLFNAVSGGDMLSPVNPYYFSTGINLTNVRTLFGTLFIYTDTLEFVLYTLFLSTCFYLLKLLTLYTSNLYVHVIYFFECSLLMMGWFEFYFFHLTVIEFPVISLLLLLLQHLLQGKEPTLQWD